MLGTALADTLREHARKYPREWKEALPGVLDVMFGELDCDLGETISRIQRQRGRSFPMPGRWTCTLTWAWYRRFGRDG